MKPNERKEMNESEKKFFVRMVVPLIDALGDPETENKARKMLGTLIVGFEEAQLSLDLISARLNGKGSPFYKRLIEAMCYFRPPGEAQILSTYKIVTDDGYLTEDEKLEAIHDLAFWITLLGSEREKQLIRDLPPDSPLAKEITQVHAERTERLCRAARDAMGGGKSRTGSVFVPRPTGFKF